MRRSLGLLCLLSLLATRESVAQVYAIYPGSTLCGSLAPVEVPVYFDPGDLTSYGYDVGRFRVAAVRAINLWNEEARTGRRLRFAGDFAGGAQAPGTIVIHHGTQVSQPSACRCVGGTMADGTVGAATIYGAACSAASTSQVCMRMQLCAGTPIVWNEGIAEAAQYSYEAILVHELGHAGYALPDAAADWGAMHGSVTTGPQPHGLHLYPVDQRTALNSVPLPETRQATLVEYDWNTYSWSGTYDHSAGVFSSVAPGVADHRGTATRPLLAVSSLGPQPPIPTSPVYQKPTVRAGVPGGSWSTYTPSTVIYGVPTSGVRVAVSDYGEVMATWMSCVEDSGYDKTVFCGCAYAYSDTPYSSGTGTWLTGHVRSTPPTATFADDDGRKTYAPCAVAYSPRNDHFVVAYFNTSTMGPFTAFTPAERSHFSLSLAVDAREGAGAWPLRYMGDLAMTRETPSPSHGLLTAAAAPSYGAGRVLAIVTMDVVWNGSRYQTMEPVMAESQSEEPYQTTRHFGTLMLGSVDAAVMFWPDVTSVAGTLVGTIRGATAWPYNYSFVLEPTALTPPAPTLTSSVSARPNFATSDGHLVVGFSRE